MTACYGDRAPFENKSNISKLRLHSNCSYLSKTEDEANDACKFDGTLQVLPNGINTLWACC